MLRVWIFGSVAITVGFWEQRGVEVESGARVEIRRVEHEVIPGAPAGVAGLRLLPVSQGIWRADLFTGPHGPIYHYHPTFEDGDVGQRHLDDELTASPVDWAMRQLADIAGLLKEAGAGDVVEDVPQAQLDSLLPEIRAAVERSFTPARREA